MLANNQVLFYKMLGQELTKARERRKLSQYDLAKLVGEQWTTINKMEKGGKFMAHHFVWLRTIGVNLNILIDDANQRLINDVPEYGEKEVEQESYQNQIEEPEFEDQVDDSIDSEDLGDLF